MHSKQALHRHLNRSRHPFFLFYHQFNQIESFQMTHQWWLISQDGKTILKVAAGVPGSIGSTSPSVSLIIVLYWTTDWLFFLDFTKKNPAVPIKDSTNRTKNATVDFEAPVIPLSDNNWRRNRQWLFHFVINGGASFRWSFGPNSAWGSIESMTILTTHPSLVGQYLGLAK